jgi:hypothetical protein
VNAVVLRSSIWSSFILFSLVAFGLNSDASAFFQIHLEGILLYTYPVGPPWNHLPSLCCVKGYETLEQPTSPLPGRCNFEEKVKSP